MLQELKTFISWKIQGKVSEPFKIKNGERDKKKIEEKRKQDLEIVCVEATQSFLSLSRQNECKTLAATDFLKCNFHMMEVLSYHCLAYMPTDVYEVASGFPVGCVWQLLHETSRCHYQIWPPKNTCWGGGVLLSRYLITNFNYFPGTWREFGAKF